MYPTSKKWKQLIYTNNQPVMNIYIDDVLINPDYIFDFKKGGTLFEEEFTLGSTPSQYIELQIHKSQFLENAKTIRVEYGLLTGRALTVAEVNAITVGTLKAIPVRSLSKSNDSYEIIPIGIYNIDSYTDDESIVNIKALDDMIKFEFNYDGSKLIKKNGYATLKEVAQDICDIAGVELRFYFFS